MDWQRIKERVTQEVLLQLQTNQGEGRVRPAPPAPQAVAGDFAADVLVLLAGPASDKVFALLEAMAGQGKVAIAATEYNERLHTYGPVFYEGAEAEAALLVKGAGRIIAPVVTTTVGAKVSQLIGDCLPAAVLVQAALAGKPVSIAREGMALPADSNWAIRRKVEDVVQALRTMGFTMTDLDSLIPVRPAAPPAAAPQPARAEVAAATVEYDRDLARLIDHTLLKPEATAEQVIKLCAEAREYNFMSVCINPTWVSLAATQLQGSPVKVCTVIGFPLGATTSEVKAFETVETIRHGATEVDMVLNVGALKSGQYDKVLADIRAVVEAARGKALTKVIIETGLLTEGEKVKACELSRQAGADFVKTSTGFGPGGATADDIALMRRTVGPDMGVKASGGVRDWEAASAMVKAGATRIGASASINIVKRVAAQGKDKY